MPLSRTRYKEAMKTIAEIGVTAGVLADSSRMERSPMEIVAAKEVLRQVAVVGVKAQDVLDWMEETDA